MQNEEDLNGRLEMSVKEYTCLECNTKFQREEKTQQELYKEMGVLADQCLKCMRRM
jgi:hypothetical protein